jgi:DNA-binding NarL/FixJ family response regulator
VKTIRVLLVDDQELFVDCLKVVLEARAHEVEVCGIARDGKAAVRLAEELAPTLVLMDVRMPVMNGVEAARIIRERHPSIKIVMLTTYDEDEYVTEALRYGAVGYLLKNMPPEELIASIRAVSGGIFQISPAAAKRLTGDRSEAASVPASISRDHPPDTSVTELLATLSPREKEILECLTLAMDNRKIANQMNLAEQTVKNYVHSIYEKLGITNRMELIRLLNQMK